MPPSTRPRRTHTTPARLIDEGSTKKQEDAKTKRKASIQKTKTSARTNAVSKARGIPASTAKPQPAAKPKKNARAVKKKVAVKAKPKPKPKPKAKAPAKATTTTEKKKAPVKTKASRSTPRNILPADQKAALEEATIETLKDRLKANDQIVTGTKTQLIQRITDCILNGCLPRCPKCFRGKLKERATGSYFCPGAFDDVTFIRCSYKTKDPITRPGWRRKDTSSLF